jgi:hypothetical protein
MIFHDDASAETVVSGTTASLREAARMIGKADCILDHGQIAEIEIAIIELQRVIDFKKAQDAHRT